VTRTAAAPLRKRLRAVKFPAEFREEQGHNTPKANTNNVVDRLPKQVPPARGARRIGRPDAGEIDQSLAALMPILRWALV